MTDSDDDLADVLAPPSGEPSPALRDALLRATERRLARDRLARRVSRTALVAVVFVAGGLAGWFAKTPVAGAPGPPAPEVVAVPIVVPVPVPERQSPNLRQTPLSASEAELRAEQADDRAEAARLYRVAGDAFLRDQDYRNATRCYRLYLARSGDAALSLETDDSWLLTSLKNAAFKEKTNVVPKTDG